jgi:maleate isomerase
MAPAEIAKDLNTQGADAIVISACVQMPSLGSVQVVEDRTGIPTLSASVSTTFQMLQRLNLKTVVPNAGALLSGRY